MRAVPLFACGLLLLMTTAAPADAQERCTDTPPTRTCASEVGPVRMRTVAELEGGDITEAEIVVRAAHAGSPGFARAAGSSMLQLVPFSNVGERTGLFAQLMKARHRSPVPWVRFGRYDWRGVERDGFVRVEAMRVERK
jgi:hypothetical protein